jgi:hypothetical protein
VKDSVEADSHHPPSQENDKEDVRSTGPVQTLLDKAPGKERRDKGNCEYSNRNSETLRGWKQRIWSAEDASWTED